jgi:hypothetical protein
VIVLLDSLVYQLAVAFSSDMMKDLARIVSSPLNKAIAVSYDIKKFWGSDSP